MKKLIIGCFLLGTTSLFSQEPLSIEKLWQVKRVSAVGFTENKKELVYRVATPDVEKNVFTRKYYKIPLSGGAPTEINSKEAELLYKKLSPNKKMELIHKPVKVSKVTAEDYYSDLKLSDGKLYTHLDYRHWDRFMDGDYKHIFIKNVTTGEEVDILEGLPYYAPQEPFGGSEDYVWSPDGDAVYYVTKAKVGTAYVNSTNTDIYAYDLATKQTKNITEGMMGYDTHPQFSKQGVLAWLSMKTDGNEADKNNLYILHKGNRINLTPNFDETISEFHWSEDGKRIFCIIPTDGTLQLFEINPFDKNPRMEQLTKGDFDISGIIGQRGNDLVVTQTTLNRATEIYTFQLKEKELKKLTSVNDALYRKIATCQVEKRYVTTTDNKKMLVYVILPPNFDKTKKYPALLYCQGGPQSALTQFYSFRWNLQLMASQGYVIIAPNRRGMPGHGVEWNAQISKDWGGQVMQDYLSATDAITQEPYIDKNRVGAIGASFGGYSVFYLAGIHQGRFNTFISHCGVFNLESMYGTTEEKFFNNNEFGGAYWEKNPDTEKAYQQHNPMNFVKNWNKPMLIIQGGKDYRVPEEQAFQAFTAAQQQGIKSEFLYFPSENHWVLSPQNSLFWQRTFFKWLQETLP